MQIIELERRLVQAEAEKGKLKTSFVMSLQTDQTVLRDHRISMFKAKEEEPSAEIEEKDALLEKLNVSPVDLPVRLNVH